MKIIHILFLIMDTVYYQSEISRTFYKEFNLFIDKEYNILKINIKNIILEEIKNEQLENKSNFGSSSEESPTDVSPK